MSRIQSVDCIRVISIFAVVVVHTAPFSSKSAPIGAALDLGTILNQMARFAVPCFFVLSGFFYATKFDGAKSVTKPTLRMAWRIALIFCAWSAIYLLLINYSRHSDSGQLPPVKAIYWSLVSMLRHPLRMILEGTKGHLWFLIGLLCSLAISGALLARNMTRSLIILSLILYGVGLLGKSYSDTPIGFHADFNFRNGPFFGLIFFVTGYLLQRKGPKESWLFWGLILTTLGLILHFIELLVLKSYWGTTMLQDYVIGTYFAGVGMALVALSNSPFLSFRAFSPIGPLVLGIYAVHYAFVDLLEPLNSILFGSTLWEVGYPISVFLLSVSTAYAMSCFSMTRQIVI